VKKLKNIFMKTILSIFTGLLIFVSLSTNINAQSNLKFGHIDFQQLVEAMPEMDTANLELQKFRDEITETLETLNVEYQRKMQEYIQKQDSLSAVVKALKEDELNGMNERTQNFQNSAQDNFNQKRAELYQPVIAKANASIKEVAEENNFFYVFDINQAGGNVILYHSKDSQDIMPLVKKKLGIN